VPRILCDACGDVIQGVQEGNVIWDWVDGKKRYAPIFVHKVCDQKYESQFPDAFFLWEPLHDFIRNLSWNLKLAEAEAEVAERKAQFERWVSKNQPVPNVTSRPHEPKARPNSPKTYFIQSELGGDVKIGKSADPNARLKQLQTGRSDRLRILKILEDDHEDKLHAKFRKLRMNGEWFRFEGELVEFLKGEE